MNQHAKIETAVPTGISPEEWQARTDLAAVYRLCAHYGWDDLIYNHCSMRVPGEPSKFLMKQHELLWTEVTASNLRKVDMNDDLDEKAGVNRPGFTLHGGVLKGRPDVNCAVHVHTETGMALAGLKGGLQMVSQQAMRFYKRIGYHPYEGITEDFSERERILKALGQNRALVLHNHGLLTVGKNAREGLHPDEVPDVGRHHPAQDGGDRRRADRDSARGLREGGGAVPDPRRRPRLGRLAGLSADDGPARSGLSKLDSLAPMEPSADRGVLGRLGGRTSRPPFALLQ